MNFGNCSDCGKYKFIGNQGKCQTCAINKGVNIKLDIIDESLRSPSILREIADTMESVRGVKCDGASSEDEKDDDLDLKEKYCRLYQAEEKYNYSDYSGDKEEKVKKAMKDALSEAKNIYDG